MRFDRNRLTLILLKEARRTQQLDSTLGNIERGDLDLSEVPICIVHYPDDMTSSFNSQSFGDSLELRDESRLLDLADEVSFVVRDTDAGSRVPNHVEGDADR